MRIFSERPLSEHLRQIKERLKEEVLSAEANYLLNANETDYIAYLVQKYRLEAPAIDIEHPWASDREANYRSSDYDRPINRTVQVVTYHVPYTGDKTLLYCEPSSRVVWTQEMQIAEDHISFDVLATTSAEQVTHDANRALEYLRQQLKYVSTEIQTFNAQLQEFAVQQVQGRKKAHLAQRNLMASLGVPVKKVGSVPETFAVPVARKTAVVVRPQAPNSAFSPEPTLDEAIYTEVLRIISETGREIERHPSLYLGKNEEALRDFLLMALSPHFQSATGETFNKAGKTDLLIRHDGRNVFVAECKIWDGPKAYLQGLDQLLQYLTWRDSKTAFVNFVRNKEFSAVLKELGATTSKHSSFVRSISKKADTWLQEEFYIPGDKTRGVQVAILSFHLPEASS